MQANVVHHHGYLAADNVGVGKSREIGLTIIDLMERAKADKRPLRLLVTTKSRDNIADLIDKELLDALLQGQDPGFEVVRVSDLTGAKSRPGHEREALPQFEHAIYVTDFYNFAEYRESLQEVGLHGILGDEAHRFKNADAAVGAAWQSLHAEIMRSTPREHQAFGYFTATPAQSVYDYQYLYGLRLWPVDGFDDWVLVVTGQATEEEATEVQADTEAGGGDLAAVADNTSGSVVGGDSADTEADQGSRGGRRRAGEDVFASVMTPSEAEQIPREWKMMGRFSARDLWRHGTEFVVHTAQLPDEARDRYDRFAELARDIIAAASRFGRMDQSGRANRFGPKGQLQAAAKRIQMQPALEEAIRIAQEHVAQGYQPVLSVINVNEMDPNEGNLAAAINMINTRDIENTDDGFVDHGEIPEALIVRAELMEKAQALGTLPNPIEMIRDAFGDNKVAFIIGASAGTRQKQAAEFQAGERDVAVISAAGSTGISLDWRVKTKKGPAHGRRLFVDVQYEWSASEAIQRYGRVDRAAQVGAPKILALNFGSASEKKFLATVANRMASLGALSKGGAESTGASALEEFEITGVDALQAARNAWAAQDEADRDLWIGRPFRNPTNPDLPAVQTRANMKQINLALLWLPSDVANNFWAAFIDERARIREAMGHVTAARTMALRGEVLRTVELAPDLTLVQVKNEAGHRFGILQGVVMPKMPRIRRYLTRDDGSVARVYVNFTDITGERVISGLEIPPSRMEGVAREFGSRLQAEKIETPEQAEAAMRAGDRLTLTYPVDKPPRWQLRMRTDQRIAIDGAKMADRELLLRHGATYSPVGNYWYVVDLARFLERFPVAAPAPLPAPPEGGHVQARGQHVRQTGGGAKTRRPGQATQTPKTPTDPARKIAPFEVPELIELAELVGRPQVVKKFRGRFTLADMGRSTGQIRLRADLFNPANRRELLELLSHEIGHLADYLPSGRLKRGNLLGRLLSSARSYLRQTYTAKDGTTIKNPEVRAELQRVTRMWRPWDRALASASYNRYRDSAEELYADALSMLLNDPALLEKTAPVFFKEFFSELDRKPEFKTEFFRLQALLTGNRDALIEHRRERVRTMFEETNLKAMDVMKLRMADRVRTIKDMIHRIRTFAQAYKETKAGVYDKHADLARFRTLNPDDNPWFMAQERNYVGSKQAALLREDYQPILDQILAAGMTWTDFGEALMYARILAGDRGKIANPLGISPQEAFEMNHQLRAKLTAQQVAVLNTQMKAFYAAWSKLAERAWRAGLITKEMVVKVRANPTYATYVVADYIDRKVSAMIKHQIGTVKDIQNVADASIMKAMAIVRAIEHQELKLATWAEMGRQAPTEIEDARETGYGPSHRVHDSQDRNKFTVHYFDQGRLRGKYVPKLIHDSLYNVSIGHNFAVIKILRGMNDFLRAVFTTYNPPFQSFNVWRDVKRSWKAGMPARQIIANYRAGLPIARARIYGPPTTAKTPRPLTAEQAKAQQGYEDLTAAEKGGMLGPRFSDALSRGDLAEQVLEATFQEFGLVGEPELPPWKQTPVTELHRRLIKGTMRWLRNSADFIETLPKAAAIVHYKKRYGDIGKIPADKRSAVRRNFGTPDVLAGGTWKPITNNTFLFSNVSMHGLAADMELAFNPQTRFEYAWKTALVNVAPKVLLFAALKWIDDWDEDDEGIDDALGRILRGITEYDMTNYLPIPLWLDELGNAVYMRFPQDDMGRIIGGLTWKLLNFGQNDKSFMRSVMQIADYMGGQMPFNLTPPLKVAIDLGELATTGNIHNPFLGRDVFSPDEERAFAASDLPGDIRGNLWAKVAGYELQQLGVNVVWKFHIGEDRPQVKTGLQRFLELPIGPPTLARWLRVTNYGETEKARALAENQLGRESVMRLRERTAVGDVLRRLAADPPPMRTNRRIETEARAIVKTLYGDQSENVRQRQLADVTRKIHMGLGAGSNDVLTTQVMAASSNAQKLAILEDAADRMTSADYHAWLAKAERLHIISKPVAQAARRGLSKPVPVTK